MAIQHGRNLAISRRGFLVGASAAALLAGCGSGESRQPAGQPGGGFPRTVQTSRGPVEIPARPERIVPLDASVDALVAMDRRPVAMVESFNAPDGIDPWLDGHIAPSSVQLLNTVDGIPFEQVAAARPDVILAGTHFQIDEDYDTLVGIAPVVTTVKGLTEDTWQDQTLLIGEALGEEAAAQQAVDAVEERIERVRAAHPQWQGKTFVSAFAFEPGAVRITSGDSFGPRFLEKLGLRFSPAAADLPSPDISFERLGLLDADLLLISATSDDLRKDLQSAPLYASLPVVQRGDVIDIDIVLSTALVVPSVLRVGYVIDELAPQMETKLA